MNKYLRDKKDVKAIDELREWCKPLCIDVVDDGCKLLLGLSGRLIDSAWYRKPWMSGKSSKRSKAAAAIELKNRIIDGRFGIYFIDNRCRKTESGASIYEERRYIFKVPKCSTPDELAVKLDLMSWKPPKRASGKWKPHMAMSLKKGIIRNK